MPDDYTEQLKPVYDMFCNATNALNELHDQCGVGLGVALGVGLGGGVGDGVGTAIPMQCEFTTTSTTSAASLGGPRPTCHLPPGESNPCEYVTLETAHEDIIAGALHGAGLHSFTDYDFDATGCDLPTEADGATSAYIGRWRCAAVEEEAGSDDDGDGT